jgi:hypothetical protein
MKVLVACEFSGIVRDAFTARGHHAVSVDLIPSERPGPHIEGDVFAALHALETAGWVPELMIAHPPCTHLAVSGARWFKEKRAEQEEALEFVRRLLDAPIPRIALENPISVISSRIRKPDQIVQPWMFGHPETKATCWWLKNLPPLEPTQIVQPEWALNADGSPQVSAKGKRDSPTHYYTSMKKNLSPEQRKQWERIHREPPGPERWKNRSRTMQGMAEAMADQWGAPMTLGLEVKDAA